MSRKVQGILYNQFQLKTTVFDKIVITKGDYMEKVTYLVPNISCMHCVHTIKTELDDIEGVQSVDADKDSKQVTIVFDKPATEAKLKSVLQEINYPVGS
jgi:copper chaperone